MPKASSHLKQAVASGKAPSSALTARAEDLAQIVAAYNQVTEKLQQSHEALRLQVDRLQAQLASKDAQLQRSRRLAALGEMAAGIAHEVRNPLAAIHLYADMIVQDIQGMTAAEKPIGEAALSPALDCGRKIISAVRGLDAIVRDVLSFAREVSPRMTRVEVTELFDRVLATCQADLSGGGVEVVREDDGQLVEWLADADLLHQALVNLVRNAVQAMEGQSVRQLCLGVHGQGPRGHLQVRDTGSGIAAADLDRIFNPFFTTRATGTGLGLAIVHRIVDAHGGTITAWNHPQGGAVFEITLPLRGINPCAGETTLCSGASA